MTDVRDRRFLRMAIRLARRGLGFASPNPTVGCVIVQGERVVGRGWHDYDKLHHAEVVAVREAGVLARGAEAYVTLEPCSHQGRTPPCTDLLVNSGIRRAVVAMIDPNPLVSGRGLEYLRSRGVETKVGLLEREAAELIDPFACRMRAGRPLVVAKVGMSLDGRIAAPSGPERRITSPASGAFTQDLRLRSDALLVGIGTILKDDPILTYRGRPGRRRPLMRVILDSQLRTPPGARVFEGTSRSPVLIFCSSECRPELRLTLERRGAEVVPGAGAPGRPDLGFVLQELARRDVLSVLVEGGSETHWAFLHRCLVDKFYFIVAPLVLGGGASVPAVGGEGYATIPDAPRFRIRRTFSAGPDLVVEAFPSYSESILSPWRE
jgi:diaminohydroxyphosphoribosylaminopyrimidine deaminase / 5-amino-6-(5-phosphoribosylamino)uracil reductase